MNIKKGKILELLEALAKWNGLHCIDIEKLKRKHEEDKKRTEESGKYVISTKRISKEEYKKKLEEKKNKKPDNHIYLKKEIEVYNSHHPTQTLNLDHSDEELQEWDKVFLNYWNVRYIIFEEDTENKTYLNRNRQKLKSAGMLRKGGANKLARLLIEGCYDSIHYLHKQQHIPLNFISHCLAFQDTSSQEIYHLTIDALSGAWKRKQKSKKLDP